MIRELFDPQNHAKCMKFSVQRAEESFFDLKQNGQKIEPLSETPPLMVGVGWSGTHPPWPNCFSPRSLSFFQTERYVKKYAGNENPCRD